MLPLLRRFWAGEIVDHEGDAFHYEGAVVRPLPLQKPLDIWLGGIAPSELRRCGRLGDGWLPSFCTPEDVRDGIVAIQGHAAEAGREIEAEHFGALIPYTRRSDPRGGRRRGRPPASRRGARADDRDRASTGCAR